jgi:hypothetical protein
MNILPSSAQSSQYGQLGTKRQDKFNQKIGKRLKSVSGPLADQFDPVLTAKGKNTKAVAQINSLVQQKTAQDPHPYGVVEYKFPSKSEAQKYIMLAHKELEPSIKKWERYLRKYATTQQEVCHDGIFEIPVHTAPKVVTVIKTNRPQDAVNLFRQAQSHLPEEEPKKPNLLTRLTSLLKSGKKQEQRSLLEEDSLTVKSPLPQDENI